MCKLYEIYKRMFDVYGEACLRKNICNSVKHELATTSLNQKVSPYSENTLTPTKEKFPGVSVKKVMLTVFWDMKSPISFDFFEKDEL